MSENTNLVPNNDLAVYDPNAVYGFEETKQEDIIIARIKVINALSPERQDKVADEGDIVNSLTKEKITGGKFIPIKQFYTNICWNPERTAPDRIFCRSFDGLTGQDNETTLICKQCRKTEFDNTKTGKDSQPKCTQYINFLGFIHGDPMPVVLSFAKTNYNEGKKMLSIARSLRTAIWNYSYILESKKVQKDRNTWYNITTRLGEETEADDRRLAFDLYNSWINKKVAADYEDVATRDYADNSMSKEIAEEV